MIRLKSEIGNEEAHKIDAFIQRLESELNSLKEEVNIPHVPDFSEGKSVMKQL
jgi:hypothetical protein